MEDTHVRDSVEEDNSALPKVIKIEEKYVDSIITIVPFETADFDNSTVPSVSFKTENLTHVEQTLHPSSDEIGFEDLASANLEMKEKIENVCTEFATLHSELDIKDEDDTFENDAEKVNDTESIISDCQSSNDEEWITNAHKPKSKRTEENVNKAVHAVIYGGMSCAEAVSFFKVSRYILAKKLLHFPGISVNKKKFTKRTLWSDEDMTKAINAVLNEGMTRLRASSVFKVPHDTLKRMIVSKFETHASKTCEICGLAVDTVRCLRRHVREEHRANAYHCIKCRQAFSNEFMLDRHKCYECYTCGKVMSHRFRFCRHLITHAKASEKSALRSELNLRKNLYECNVCSARYNCKRFLARHIRSVHLNQKFVCASCGARYTEDRPCNNCDKMVCPACSKQVAVFYWTKHVTTVHCARYSKQNNSFSCLSCEQNFSHDVWITHLSTSAHKANTKEYNNLCQNTLVCPICKKKAMNKKRLSEHLQKVHKVRVNGGTIHCILCNDTFHDACRAKHHLGSRPHLEKVEEAKSVCAECGRKFSEPKTLSKHMEVHVRPTNCIVKVERTKKSKMKKKYAK